MQNELLLVKKEQNDASNPEYSIWVNASAGSGKTTVLVKRVLRMLLNGVELSKILCITFTNTGANEMKNRINNKLASFIIMNDRELLEELKDMDEIKDGDSDTFKKNKMKIARTLFTKLLDESNDLKILTIHGFCQQIIKRFPLEMRITPNFKIVDEIEANKFLNEVKNNLFLHLEDF
jgi:ATP-dependent helicase/nuclease subunit A